MLFQMTDEELNILKGIGATVLTAAGRAYISAILEQNRVQKISLVQDFQEAFEAAKTLTDSSPICRITVLQGRKRAWLRMNNDTPKYTIYALYQVRSGSQKHDARNYDGMPPDDAYIDMLEWIAKNPNKAYVVTKEMIEAPTLLGGIYRNMNIVDSKVYLLRNTRKNIFYISFASQVPFGGDDTEERTRIVIQKFKKALQKF